MALRATRTLGLFVRTTMLSSTVLRAASWSMPSSRPRTPCTHQSVDIAQEAQGWNVDDIHGLPAASKMEVCSGTVTCLPSIVRVTTADPPRGTHLKPKVAPQAPRCLLVGLFLGEPVLDEVKVALRSSASRSVISHLAQLVLPLNCTAAGPCQACPSG